MFLKNEGRIRAAAIVVSIVAAAAAVFAAVAWLPGSSKARGKALLISVDTLRPDFLGCYGNAAHGSETIDDLASRGMVFDNALCNCAMTTPSHASMLSGLYPWSHGVHRNNEVIPGEVTLLSEILREQGFATAAFVSLSTVKGSNGFRQGFDLYDDELPTLGHSYTRHYERVCSDTVEKAIEWMDNRHDDSFFVFLHLCDPHGPYSPPEEYLGDLSDTPEGPELALGHTNFVDNAIPRYQILSGVKEAGFYIERYAAEKRYVDDCLDALFSRMMESGIYEETLIVFTSDHGESMGDHSKWFQHGTTLYGPQVKVPLIISGPGVSKGRTPGMAQTVDIVPTLLDILGLPIGEEIEGRSLLPALRGLDNKGHEPWRGMLNVRNQKIKAIQEGSYKLIDIQNGWKTELYDLDNDPDELRDIAGDQKETAERLSGDLDHFIEKARGLESKKKDLSQEEAMELRKEMEALGYVE